ncbi:MAG: 3-phosphoshikimate 1-carboxyvinyltransferase [Prevotella sp.]|nr:3-phosphoshikimate 1-carboxyvinyltransferase [Prevotella sp.]
MQYILTAPEKINTTINLPASKSISNRALIIHALSRGDIMPDNLSDCDDTEVILNALENMPDIIDIKAGGTAMRFMTAYLAVTPGEHILTGTERMKQRPIGVLVDALRFLRADISYEGVNGFPPLRIKGKTLWGGHIEIPGNVSSQFISAILMIAPLLNRGLKLKLTGDIVSRPYIDMTLCIMRDFGAEVEWTGNDTISVTPKPYISRKYFIENDWSAASYWYEMVALSKDEDIEVKLTGLMDGSRQGDSSVKYLFNMLGIKTVFKTREKGKPTVVTLKKFERKLARLDYDFINQPDMAQTFVVCCALLDVPFRFSGLTSLKIKETDRLEALKTEMRKLGYVIKDNGRDMLSWDGERCKPTPEVAIDTYEDHRMAMAFAPVSLRVDGLRINNPQVVSKSYPHFWNDLRQAGFGITEVE